MNHATFSLHTMPWNWRYRYPYPYYPYPYASSGFWLIVTTVNALTGVPLIEHRFFGRTPEDASARYETHMQADQFIRACGSYDGQPHEYNGTPCRSSWRWERA